MKENGIKITITTALAGLSAYLGNLIIPLVILLFVVVLDYGTGMGAAWVNQEISSKRGLRGILKKLSYFIVVAVGMIVDYVINYAIATAGIEFDSQIHIIALLVSVWLIINELVSILENLAKIGVPLPEFLLKIVTKLKVAVEKKAGGE